MFSKQESARIRQEFWISFGKSFPKKWLLYNTKIKGLSFKFQADPKSASVCLDIENSDELINELLFDQFVSLKNILTSIYLPNVTFDPDFQLENGKVIHRIYVLYPKKFSIHNKNTWRDCFEFFVDIMTKFETFFYEYEEYIRSSIR